MSASPTPEPRSISPSPPPPPQPLAADPLLFDIAPRRNSNNNDGTRALSQSVNTESFFDHLDRLNRRHPARTGFFMVPPLEQAEIESDAPSDRAVSGVSARRVGTGRSPAVSVQSSSTVVNTTSPPPEVAATANPTALPVIATEAVVTEASTNQNAAQREQGHQPSGHKRRADKRKKRQRANRKLGRRGLSTSTSQAQASVAGQSNQTAPQASVPTTALPPQPAPTSAPPQETTELRLTTRNNRSQRRNREAAGLDARPEVEATRRQQQVNARQEALNRTRSESAAARHVRGTTPEIPPPPYTEVEVEAVPAPAIAAEARARGPAPPSLNDRRIARASFFRSPRPDTTRAPGPASASAVLAAAFALTQRLPPSVLENLNDTREQYRRAINGDLDRSSEEYITTRDRFRSALQVQIRDHERDLQALADVPGQLGLQARGPLRQDIARLRAEVEEIGGAAATGARVIESRQTQARSRRPAPTSATGTDSVDNSSVSNNASPIPQPTQAGEPPPSQQELERRESIRGALRNVRLFRPNAPITHRSDLTADQPWTLERVPIGEELNEWRRHLSRGPRRSRVAQRIFKSVHRALRSLQAEDPILEGILEEGGLTNTSLGNRVEAEQSPRSDRQRETTSGLSTPEAITHITEDIHNDHDRIPTAAEDRASTQNDTFGLLFNIRCLRRQHRHISYPDPAWAGAGLPEREQSLYILQELYHWQRVLGSSFPPTLHADVDSLERHFSPEEAGRAYEQQLPRVELNARFETALRRAVRGANTEQVIPEVESERSLPPEVPPTLQEELAAAERRIVERRGPEDPADAALLALPLLRPRNLRDPYFANPDHALAYHRQSHGWVTREHAELAIEEARTGVRSSRLGLLTAEALYNWSR